MRSPITTVETLAPVRVAAASRLLEQHLISCPGCGKPAAVHLDVSGGEIGEPTGRYGPSVVRVVCPDACAVSEREVLGRLADTGTDTSPAWSDRATA